MPLPLQTYRVFPNPWALIHPEKGPQGACPKAAHDDNSPLRFVGAERSSVVTEARPKLDPRGDRISITFSYPNLDGSLVKGKPEELSARAPDGYYYRDRMVDGSLVPADDATLKAIPNARFKSLADAKKAGVAEFDAHHGEGSWAELEKLLAPTASAPAPAATTPEPTKNEKKAGS